MNIEQAAKIDRLYRKYVGRGSINLRHLDEVIKREAIAAERGTIRVSSGLLTELRNDRAYVGRVLNSQTRRSR